MILEISLCFQKKCGFYLMIIHVCILSFWKLAHVFQKMRNLHYGYSLLYIVLEISLYFPKTMCNLSYLHCVLLQCH
ncbi:MAG: hypothetical protein ACKPKO_17230, partial [Candidatus Fonsibacter sp.]